MDSRTRAWQERHESHASSAPARRGTTVGFSGVGGIGSTGSPMPTSAGGDFVPPTRKTGPGGGISGGVPTGGVGHGVGSHGGVTSFADEERDDLDANEAMDILYEISTLLNTGLEKDSLAALVGLCELGVNPEALAEAVKDLRAEASRLRGE
eukprot:TRINITY_DN30414_c0_g1_i1.p2 TRINITY_DN30414_c0_g1~~TRINITY_DN30414_c0_g1_i1.p2  ORF type:complete len:152 (+),score=26.58 TRINITY_DN30414_c0_g1_i1:227-682(+)